MTIESYDFSQHRNDKYELEVANLSKLLFALGLNLSAQPIQISAPAEICELAKRRWAARQAKDFATADALRQELAAAGWAMLDGKDGYRLERSAK
jgi:cysteinyl-tRNA synthetase